MTGDDPHQAAVAGAIVEDGFVLTGTVFLETEWVLRSRYGFTRAECAEALRMILDLPGAADVPGHAHWAVGQLAAGADFADVMHLATALGATRFATFDAGLAAQAGPNTPLPIETLA